MTDIVHEEQKITKDDPRAVPRRRRLRPIGLGFDALVALGVATPIVRYLVGPLRRRKFYGSWVSLGPLSQFPVGEPRLATYENPFSRRWGGDTDRTACW